MVYDNIKNSYIYYGMSKEIQSGLKYLEKLAPDIKIGTYVINENVKAIVSEYETKESFIRGYEAHKHVIDIQYPIIGRERIKWSFAEGMDVNIPYDAEKDRTFYKNPKYSTHVDIGEGLFAIMFPSDTHSPQLFVDKPEKIKKVTIKVKII